MFYSKYYLFFLVKLLILKKNKWDIKDVLPIVKTKFFGMLYIAYQKIKSKNIKNIKILIINEYYL